MVLEHNALMVFDALGGMTALPSPAFMLSSHALVWYSVVLRSAEVLLCLNCSLNLVHSRRKVCFEIQYFGVFQICQKIKSSPTFC